jgi:hypothetical protein
MTRVHLLRAAALVVVAAGCGSDESSSIPGTPQAEAGADASVDASGGAAGADATAEAAWSEAGADAVTESAPADAQHEATDGPAEAGEGCKAVCGASESCMYGGCAPFAFLLAAHQAKQPPFGCPAGYQEAGHWKPGPGANDGNAEAIDLHGYQVDAGWVWLCSADPKRVGALVQASDCGAPAAEACGGKVRGSWHVGAGCSSTGPGGVDRNGLAIPAGWMQLCVEPGLNVRVETASGDCGASGPGCGAERTLGSWHTMPAACGSGNTGVGDTQVGIESGWMSLCTDSTRPLIVDASSLDHKVMAGYQGWFAAEGEGSQRNSWRHWSPGVIPAADNVTFDLWPDLSEYGSDELFPTTLQYKKGGVAGLYSAWNATTVDRHFRWMADYGIDGAFLQRFLVETLQPADLEFRDKVTLNARNGAQNHGRALALMYDISGSDEAGLVNGLIADWKHVVDELGLTSSPRYLRHQGLPLVAIWGLGFTDRPGSQADAMAIIDFFRNAPDARYRAAVMGGVPTNWRTSSGDSKPGWLGVYESFDIISPWSVGRYADEAGVASFNVKYVGPDLAATKGKGIGYMPVVWPGFSWANLQTNASLNQIPRNAGGFLWRQMHDASKSGATMLYVAMFDEVDEGTAIFKASATQADLPSTGTFLALDADGMNVPSDWYLRVTAAGAKALAGQDVWSASVPLK